jgi:hypothetical protein
MLCRPAQVIHLPWYRLYNTVLIDHAVQPATSLGPDQVLMEGEAAQRFGLPVPLKSVNNPGSMGAFKSVYFWALEHNCFRKQFA